MLIGGRDVTALPPAQRGIAMVFQNYALFPHLSVGENIGFGLSVRKVPKAEADKRLKDAADLLGLSHLLDRRPGQLSGGQQQRVALARSLAKRPQLLLLDEPLGALDKKLREQTQFELVNIIESVGVTVVMVTHDQEEAMTMASRIAVMSEGRVLQTGKPQEVYEYPNCRFVAEFIGNVNLLDGTVRNSEPSLTIVDTALGAVELGHGVSAAEGMPISIAVRPEKIRISTEPPDASRRNVFRGKVIEIAYLGDVNVYIVLMPDGTRMKITGINSIHESEASITWEDEVYFWWNPQAAVALTQ